MDVVLEALRGLRIEASAERARGGHDLRSWFITRAQERGAHRDLLRIVSHGIGSDVMSGYTRTTWAALCGEMAKLAIELPAAAQVAEIACQLVAAPLRNGVNVEDYSETLVEIGGLSL